MRLFLALNLDDAVRERVHRDAASLRVAIPAASWVRARNLHLTLKFLGDVEAGPAAAIGDVLRPVAARHAAIDTALAGAGAFPNLARPRVVWIGVRDDGAVRALAGDVDAACAGLGFPADPRPYNAHVTLGRVKRDPPRGIAATFAHAARSLSGPYPVRFETLDLMQSELASEGSRYSLVVSLPLVGA